MSIPTIARRAAAALLALTLLAGCVPAQAATIEPCQPFPECIPGRVLWLPLAFRP